MEKRLHWIFKVIIIVLIVSILVVLVNIFAKPGMNATKLKLVTENYILEPQACEQEGELMVPLRSFADFVGAEVVLNTDNTEYCISKDDSCVVIKGGEVNALVNDTEVQLKTAPGEYEGVMFVPFNVFSEYLSTESEYDSDTKTVTVKNH